MNNADKLALELADHIDRLRGQRQRQRQAPSPEDNVRQMLERLNDVREPISVEDALLRTIFDRQHVKRTRSTLQPIGGDGVTQETVEASLLNAQGVLEEIEEERVFMLDDGMPSAGNVAQCQSCGGFVHVSSLRSCPCGIRVCIRQNCGKGDGRDRWYCSGFHWFLNALGLPLR